MRCAIAGALDIERERDYRNAEQRLQPELRRPEPLPRHVSRRLRARLPDGVRPLRLQRRLSGGGRTGRVEPRRDSGWSYPAPGRIGIRQRRRIRTAASYAFQNGVNDGYQKGRDDARDGKYPDYARQKWYRTGDHHYDSATDRRKRIEVQYRRGFQEGYDRAYRELDAVRGAENGYAAAGSSA